MLKSMVIQWMSCEPGGPRWPPIDRYVVFDISGPWWPRGPQVVRFGRCFA